MRNAQGVRGSNVFAAVPKAGGRLDGEGVHQGSSGEDQPPHKIVELNVRHREEEMKVQWHDSQLKGRMPIFNFF